MPWMVFVMYIGDPMLWYAALIVINLGMLVTLLIKGRDK